MLEEGLLRSRAARMTLVMACLFASTGMALPYLGRWLEGERGLGGAEIGAVLSLAQLTRILVGPLVALWADGARDRRTPIRLIAAGAIASYGGFFFLAHDFWSLLAFGFLGATCIQGLVPFVEAGVLRATAQGKLNYGFARGIGSLAFIAANVAGGVLIARFGLGAVAVWVLAALGATAFASWAGLKPDPAPPRVKENGARFGMESAMGLLADRRFVLLIVSCGLIQCAHAFYYGFSTIVWRGQGVTADVVGYLWAWGVLVEVAFLWSLPLVERRVTPAALILIGASAGTLRWLSFGFAPVGLLLWPLQALHGLSFAAAHVGAMRLLYRTTPEASAGMAQTLYASLSGGLLMGLATLGAGLLYDHIGARGYWVMAAICLCGGFLALGLLRTPRRQAIG